MCPLLHPHLHSGTLAAPSPAAVQQAHRWLHASPFPGLQERDGGGDQGQGREGRPPWGPLCTGCPSPTARPPLPTVRAPSRVTPGQRDCISEAPGSCQWPLPRKPPPGGADLTALVTFVLAPGAAREPPPHLCRYRSDGILSSPWPKDPGETGRQGPKFPPASLSSCGSGFPHSGRAGPAVSEGNLGAVTWKHSGTKVFSIVL